MAISKLFFLFRTHSYLILLILDKPMDIMNCLNDEELEALKEDREPVEAPKIPDYIKPQPGKPGKMLWFSGPPGAGKSTTAQLLARNNGYIYYEADCMSIFVNPFIDVHTPEPSMAQMNQKPLKVLQKSLLSFRTLIDEYIYS